MKEHDLYDRIIRIVVVVVIIIIIIIMNEMMRIASTSGFGGRHGRIPPVTRSCGER
jgi:hypothetical protein